MAMTKICLGNGITHCKIKFNMRKSVNTDAEDSCPTCVNLPLSWLMALVLVVYCISIASRSLKSCLQSETLCRASKCSRHRHKDKRILIARDTAADR